MFNLKRQPTHPGVMLREEFVVPMGLTQVELAQRLKTTFRTVNEILNAKRNISPDIALRLARLLGTSEELWLNLQDQYDLHRAREKNKALLKSIKPLRETVEVP